MTLLDEWMDGWMAFACSNVGKVLFLAFTAEAHLATNRHAHSLADSRPLPDRATPSIYSCVHQGARVGHFLVNSSINGQQP